MGICGYIPKSDKELMDKFAQMLRSEPSFGYVYQLAKASERMLAATLAGDTGTMEEILELKVNHTPEEAIAQIREKNYALCFRQISERGRRTGKRIPAVGIVYGKKEKRHWCKVEEWEAGQG